MSSPNAVLTDAPASVALDAAPPSAPLAVSVEGVRKKYRLFDSQTDRLKEALHPFRRSYHRPFWALDGVTFDVAQGETFAILGRNGSGKSTLLQIISGILRPTEGRVAVNGRIAALLELGAGFNPEFSGRDNVLLNGAIMGIPREEMLERMPDIEAFADVGQFFDQPVKTYSSGMYVRVAFAAAINIDPAILIVDEALAVGDIRFQEKCFRKFREFQDAGRTILLVTHATSIVEQLCSRAVLLEGGKVHYAGDPQATVNAYEALLFPRSHSVLDGASAPHSFHTEPHADAQGEAHADAPVWDAPAGDVPPELADFLARHAAEDRCPQRRSYNANEIRFGEAGGSIVDYLIVTPDEVDPVSIRTGTTVDVYIKVLGGTGIRRPDIGIGVFTAAGFMVCSGSTILSSMRIPPVRPGGFHVYRISFRCRMTQGHYFIHFALTEATPEGEVRHDARRSVASFEVPATPHLEGLCDLDMAVADLTPAAL